MKRWGVYPENGGWVIRRGKERLKVADYAHIRKDRAALDEFVKRKNAPIDAKEKVEFKHSFISPELLGEFEEYLSTKIRRQRDIDCQMKYLNKYFLNFFVGELDLMNPLDWHKVHETKWNKFLLSDRVPPSPKTKSNIIQIANRFISWLRIRRPTELPAELVFAPIPLTTWDRLEVEWENRGKKRKYISDEDIALIRSEAPKNIKPFIELAWRYGLRRGEALGLLPGDVRKDCLAVDRQLLSLGETDLPKGRKKRQTPHWRSKAAQTYALVEEAQPHVMHPDTLTDRWNALMLALQDKYERPFEYDFHDIRHTFITQVVRKATSLSKGKKGIEQSLKDIQVAVGHKDLKTTLGYVRDDRELDDTPFDPKAA